METSRKQSSKIFEQVPSGRVSVSGRDLAALLAAATSPPLYYSSGCPTAGQLLHHTTILLILSTVVVAANAMHLTIALLLQWMSHSR